MHTTALLLASLLPFALTTPLPASTIATTLPWAPWRLSSVTTRASAVTPGADPLTHITFSFEDPNTHESTTCATTFTTADQATSAPTETYVSCETPGFAFRFPKDGGWVNIREFRLDLMRTWIDRFSGNMLVTGFGTSDYFVGDDSVCTFDAMTTVGECKYPAMNVNITSAIA